MATGRRTSGRAGTGFINLADWGQANAAGSQRLVDSLAQGANAAGTRAETAIDEVAQRFGHAVNAGSTFYAPGWATAGQARQLGDATYTGPDNLSSTEGYNEAMGAAQRAGQSARALGDLYGRSTALQDAFGKSDADGNYTASENLLDSALAGQAGGSRFAQLGAQWGGLLGRANQQEQAAADTARTARQRTAENAARYAADAPVLQQRDDAARRAEEQRHLEEVAKEQEAAERARPEITGEDNRHIPRNRAREPRGGTKSTLSGWGSGGGWT